MTDRPIRLAVSVVARDRVGIVADVSEALYGLGANLEAMSQTVVWGWFTMIICAAFPEGVTAEEVKKAVEASGDFEAIVLPQVAADRAAPTEGEPFVVTVVGEDKPGILRRLTRCFAEMDINIEDVWNEVRGNQIIVIVHVTVPPAVDPKELRYELEKVGTELDVNARLQHQDIFTATNSLAMRTRNP